MLAKDSAGFKYTNVLHCILQQIGVYLIKNKINDKVYIGSTHISFSKRWGDHKCELRKGIHRNRHLQSDWNKYGESAFEFNIENIVQDFKDVIKAEQQCIDRFFENGERHKIYNFLELAGSAFGHKLNIGDIMKRSQSKNWVCVSPHNEIYRIRTLRSFCEQHGLRKDGMIDVARGKLKQHRGWLCFKADEFNHDEIRTKRRHYTVISPAGDIHETADLHKFCFENNLDRRCMLKVISNYENRTHHKGWKIYYTDSYHNQVNVGADRADKTQQLDTLVQDTQ